MLALIISRSMLNLYSALADPHFWDSYQTLDQALFHFKESLPPVDATMLAQYFFVENESRDAQDFFGILPPSEEEATESSGWLCYTIVFAHVSVATAIIQLHGIFAERDDSEAAVVFAAARDIASIIRNIGTPQSAADLEASTTGVPVLTSLNPRKLHKLIGVRLPILLNHSHLTGPCAHLLFACPTVWYVPWSTSTHERMAPSFGASYRCSPSRISRD